MKDLFPLTNSGFGGWVTEPWGGFPGRSKSTPVFEIVLDLLSRFETPRLADFKVSFWTTSPLWGLPLTWTDPISSDWIPRFTLVLGGVFAFIGAVVVGHTLLGGLVFPLLRRDVRLDGLLPFGGQGFCEQLVRGGDRTTRDVSSQKTLSEERRLLYHC